MLITIICAIITGVFLAVSMKEKDKIYIGDVIKGLICGCFVFICASGMSYSVADVTYYENEVITTGVEIQSSDELLNFQDVQQTKSEYSFLVAYASGNSADIMNYSYYVKTEYGYEYKKISPEQESVYIRYCDEGELPRVETETDKLKEEKILTQKPNIWTTNIFSYLDYHKYNIGDVVETKEYTSFDERTIFYIPKDSLLVQYDVDMK